MAVDWEILEVIGSETDAELVCGFLESRGVPCRVDSAYSHEFPAPMTSLGEVRVEVPGDRIAEARRLLEESDLRPAREDGEAD